MNPLEGDTMKGEFRSYYSVRIILLCVSIAALVAALVSIPVVLILTADANDRAYKNDVGACVRQNVARREANKRLVTQRSDASNLGKLTHTLSKVRTAEAKAFEKIAVSFHIEKEVEPLVVLLNKAATEDADIAAEQDAVVFKDVVIQNCHSTKVVPKQ